MKLDELVEELDTLRILSNKHGKSDVGHRLNIIVGRLVREGVENVEGSKVPVVQHAAGAERPVLGVLER